LSDEFEFEFTNPDLDEWKNIHEFSGKVNNKTKNTSNDLSEDQFCPAGALFRCSSGLVHAVVICTGQDTKLVKN
jgi:hypothetical protein